MKFKDELKKTFGNSKEINYFRTKASTLVLVGVSFLFFLTYFLIGANFYYNTLSIFLPYIYVMFIFSIFLYGYNYFHYKLLGKNKLLIIIISIILLIIFVFFSLPFIVPFDTLKSII